MKTIGGAALAILMLAMFAQIQVSAQVLEEVPLEQSRGIVGAWRTVVTPRNCQTGLPVAPASRGLLTFNEGGTLAEYNSPGPNPALRSPGHGVWEQRSGGGRIYSSVFRNYSSVFVINRYDASGVFISSQKIRTALELSADGNGFTTNAAIEIFDANDNLIGTGCATAVGTRIE
ncbi:MAG: hypothetical protein M3525_12235 [Acidobacteriota bacterium]|nr:hypothetical protein [Acidobacteriota bacterium]